MKAEEEGKESAVYFCPLAPYWSLPTNPSAEPNKAVMALMAIFGSPGWWWTHWSKSPIQSLGQIFKNIHYYYVPFVSMCLIDFHRLHEDLWLFGHEASADLHASNMKIQMRSVTEISLESTDQKKPKKEEKSRHIHQTCSASAHCAYSHWLY